MACQYEYQGKWYTEKGLRAAFEQLNIDRTTPSKASPETLRRIKEFLNRIGVSVENVAGISIDGKVLGINGIADPLNSLIQITQGKEDVALTEEAMHMAVEIIEQMDPPLYRRMFNAVGSYQLTNEVFQDYGSIPFYQMDGKPDVVKLKKEAIGKILAQTIINKAENINEKPELLVQVKAWWQQIIDFLKGLFLKAQMNPFEEVASQILEGTFEGDATTLTGTPFAQLSQSQGIVNQLQEVNRNLAKTNEGYELNGEKVRKTVDKQVEDFIKSRRYERPVSDVQATNRKFKEETEKGTKEDIADILNRYIDEDGSRRTTPLPQSLPSSIDPYSNSFYLTLEEGIRKRLDSYPADTRFLKSLNIYDDKTNMAGTVDLIAILPDGKMDVLQFKVPDTGSRPDIPVYLQEAYSVELENIRRILQNGYGISRKQFRNTRAVPVRASYVYNIQGDPKSGLRLYSLAMGDINIKTVEDPILVPVASKSETTGNTRLDELISRLIGLVDKMSRERVTPDKRLEKGQRIARLVASIRQLRVQGKAEGVLGSAKVIVARQKERLASLEEKIANLDPANSTDKDLNDIASQIMEEKDQVEIYGDLYSVFRDVFTEDTDIHKTYVQEARDVSDEADRIANRYWDLSVKFRTEKMAAKIGIKDEFNPEKQLTLYRRMIRSLSQSSIKAGAMLWGLVKSINSRLDTQFQDRLKQLKTIEEGVEQWLKGKSIKDLYNKIFQFRDGKWTGRIIQRYSRDFYTQLREAQDKQDIRWVKDNIDVEAYNAWYLEEHKRLVENAKTARVHEDDEKNKQLIVQSLQDFVNTFSLRRARGVNPFNYRLKDFPLAKWHSAEYQDLLRPENEPILKLYNHWVDRLKESLSEGLIHEHMGYSWFPNVRRGLLEKLTTAPGSGKLKSFLGSSILESEDTTFGKRDPVTGKPIDEIHANFVSDLGEWVKGADDNYFLDYSEKSMDIFKVMALWDKEIIRYKLRTESEALARMLHYTEEHRKAYKTKKSGKLDVDESGFPITISNEVNAKYVKEHIDAVWYGKNMSDQMDLVIEIPYKAVVERINKLFGKQIIPVPEEEKVAISGTKALSAINRFFVAKTLGLNIRTSVAQLFGGTVNTYINQGKFFNKKDVLESELEYVSGSFWKTPQTKKMAGLLAYLHIYTDDKSVQQIRNLSVSGAVKFFSSDHLFVGQRIADNAINNVITMSYIKNTMVKDGKLINIREFARKELGHDDKYAGTYQQVKDFEERLEKRVQELKESGEALVNVARIENDQIVIPGMDRSSDTMVEFREGVKNFMRNAMGNTTREDLSLYKRSVIWQSFFMFKNWIPRMLDVRGQSLKYNPGSQSYEWGRLRMLGNAVYNLVRDTNTSLLKTLSGNREDLISVAKKVYKEKQKDFAGQEEEFTMTEAEFVDMYIKGARAQFKELGLALAMVGIMIAARAATPDEDEEDYVKGGYKWGLRALDKFQDEVSFFYNPISFTNIVNGSVFPAVNLLVDIEKFFAAGFKKIFYRIIGDDEEAEKQHAAKYLFRIMPITKELITYVAIFNEDLARDYGVRVTSQYGSFR